MNRYKSNYSLIDALQEGQSMVNALEPSDLSALHSRVPKFDFHLQSGGQGEALSKKLLLGETWPPLPIPKQKRPPVQADLQCFLKPELQGRGDTHVRGIKSGRPSLLYRQTGYIPKHFIAMCLPGVLFLTATSRAVSALEIK